MSSSDSRLQMLDGARRRGRMLWPFGVVGLLWLTVVAAGIGQWSLTFRAEWPAGATPPDLPSALVVSLVTVAVTTLGGLVVLRGDTPRYGWLMIGMGVVLGVVGIAALYSSYSLEWERTVSPVIVWVQDLWMVSQMIGFLLLPALFPDGRMASARWRRAVRAVAFAWLVVIVLFVFAVRPATNIFLDVGNPPANPTGLMPIPMDFFNNSWAFLALTSVLVGLGSLVARWRHAGFDLRQRFKWILYAFGVMLSMAGLSLVNTLLQEAGVDLGVSTLLEWAGPFALLGLAVSLGFAVLRFRLYDVDLVINRTIVYGVLSIGVVLAYMTVVVAIGALVPVDQSLLALVTTGIVAVAFAPLKTRVQDRVNRMMYGQRDDPYGVLVEMGRLMTEMAAPEETLQILAGTVARSLKLPGAAIELDQGGVWTTQAAFGTGADVESGGLAIPLRHQGEVVGRLVVMPRSPHDPLTTKDINLLEDIAHPAGAIARSVRLTTALQHSRERLVMAREEERRRIRRDLHDGLGPSLASQTLLLDAVVDRLRDDQSSVREMVSALKQQNQQLVADIRRLVYELRPPTLDEFGVAGALRAHMSQLGQSGRPNIEVTTVPDPLPALPAAVEVAAYRIAREAIMNTVGHADATSCVARLEATSGELTISVRDDGKGIGSDVQRGVGLISMRERSEELGGTFEAGRRERGGTEVVAVLPLASGRALEPKTPSRVESSAVGTRHG